MLSAYKGLAKRLAGVPLIASLPVIGLSLVLVALLTTAIGVASLITKINHVTIIFLIPVLVAAIRGGIVPAVVVALVGIGVSAFFFFPPLYDFRVSSRVQLIDLVLFIFVAVVTGHLAASLRRAKMREQADALREALIGSVSHELRSPLSAILGSASVLIKAPEILKDARLGPLVSGLHEEAERLNGLIQDLLDASRISSEGIRPHAEWVDPGDIVNAAIERRLRLLANHQLKLVVADNLPLVYVDSVLIERALGHLIENAVKFSAPSLPIEVSAGRVDRMIRFAVRDEGVGLSADERDHIWERLYRGPRHAAIGGSGLGLWIARALVTASGGEVDAFSAGVGCGTTLSIHLPVSPRADYEQLRAPDEESPADRVSH